MAISEETIRQVRESTDIVEVISEYVSLRKRGASNFFGLCPFHEEKTPSFSVSSDRQIYRCFGCGKGGNVFTFLMEMERISFIDAVRRLAEQAGIRLENDKQPTVSINEDLYRANELANDYFRYYLSKVENEETHFARNYLCERGIDEEIEVRFELGLSPNLWDGLIISASKRGVKPEVLERAGLVIRREGGGWYDRFRGRLMFPIRNAGRKVIGFGARILYKTSDDENAPKYVNSPETPIYQKGYTLYGIPQARDAMRQESCAILVEGYTDLIALHRVGLKHSVATLGTALTSHQAALIKRFANRVIILYDADQAGRDAAFRGADIMVGTGLETFVALLPPGEDPDTLANKGGRDALEKVLDSAQALVDFKIDHFRKLGRLATPQGKTEATRALIETLRRISDPITRQYMMHEAAEKLGVDERVLGLELHRLSASEGRGAAIQSSSPLKLSGFDQLLADLLWVLLHHPQYYEEVFTQFHPSDLGNHPLRPAFDRLEEVKIEQKQMTEADLYDALGDQSEMLLLLNQVVNRPEPDNPQYILEIVQKTPLYLKRMQLKKDIAEMKEAMKRGKKGALEEYSKLLKALLEIEEKLPKDKADHEDKIVPRDFKWVD